MKNFSFKHGPGRVDGLRVIANIGEKGSVQKLPAALSPGESYRWIGAASIVVSGVISITCPNGAEFILRRGDVLPSISRFSGDGHEEALEDNTVLYCFQTNQRAPMWSLGFVLNPATPLQLPARKFASHCILVSGHARCNDLVDLNAEAAPHILRVSPDKPLSIIGDGVLLYMFKPEFSWSNDPAEDDDPLLNDYIKGLTVLRS